MLAKTIATLAFAFLASSATAFPQSATPAPQVQDLGNGCFSVTFKSGGSSSSSKVCGAPGSGAPKVTDQGNGCFSVVLGGSTSSVCAGGSSSSDDVDLVASQPAAPAIPQTTQTATAAPQVQDIGNGCFSITFKSGGSSSSSTVCGPPGSGAPQLTDQGNGCFSVVLGGSTSNVCASSSGGSSSDSSTVVRQFSETGKTNAINKITQSPNGSPASDRHDSSNSRA